MKNITAPFLILSEDLIPLLNKGGGGGSQYDWLKFEMQRKYRF